MLKPILFNTEMVKSVLDGRKTVTRRVIKPQPEIVRLVWGPNEKSRTFSFACCGEDVIDGTPINYDKTIKAPYWSGDILWVRETWAKDPFSDGYIYPTEVTGAGQKWSPSIYMPKEAARIFLRVVDVRVERLKEITFRDIRLEGVNWWEDACEKWINVWNRTIKPTDLPVYGWDANPWVWVISFDRISKEEAQS